MQVTQKEIAVALSLSRATITKALKDHPDIAADTVKRVKGLAKSLGYTPNYIARSLSSRQTNLIGVIFPKISHSLFSTAIESVYESVSERGFEIIPMISFEDTSRDKRIMETLMSMRVAGIIADISQDTQNNELYETAKKSGVPVIFLDRAIEDGSFSRVTVNDYESAFDVINYVISIGYTKIAHFAGLNRINIGKNRCNGYKDALKQNGIPVNPDWIYEGGFTADFGYVGLKKLLNSNEMPEMIFAVNDSVAHGIYKAAKELNIRISEDLGVIGFGDIEHSQLLTPPLASVHIPIESMAQKAVELLFDEIASPNDTEPQHLAFKTEIKIRKSILQKKEV